MSYEDVTDQWELVPEKWGENVELLRVHQPYSGRLTYVVVNSVGYFIVGDEETPPTHIRPKATVRYFVVDANGHTSCSYERRPLTLSGFVKPFTYFAIEKLGEEITVRPVTDEELREVEL